MLGVILNSCLHSLHHQVSLCFHFRSLSLTLLPTNMLSAFMLSAFTLSALLHTILSKFPCLSFVIHCLLQP